MSAPGAAAARQHELSLTLVGGARVRFTTRANGNLSTQRGVEHERGRATRERLRAQLALESLCASRQVHGPHVHLVRERLERGAEPLALDADGHATALHGVGAMVLTADCVPVALAGHGAVAMLHAGWRGLAAGVLEHGVRALRELGAGDALEAAVGPCAGACCYAVGAEVHDAFGAQSKLGDAASQTIDLRAIARARLLAAGVGTVHDVRACTICDERFFSHRREGERAGRQAGVAWLS